MSYYLVSPNGLLNLLPPCVHGHIARQVLVLPPDTLQVLYSLVPGGLDIEVRVTDINISKYQTV